MSPLWRTELRVGYCPDRLVTARGVHIVSDDGITQVREFAKRNRLCVVLSNHLVRYAVLPWKKALVSDDDWDAYARHSFETTYGTAAASWLIRVCGGRSGEPRIACATETTLIESLRALRGMVSIQPYLMAAFNARRRAFDSRSCWFVLQEPRRLVISLIAKGEWRRIRTRQAASAWREGLADLLEREQAADAQDQADVVFACTEDELPPRLGRFRIVDLSLPRGAATEARARIMALH